MKCNLANPNNKIYSAGVLSLLRFMTNERSPWLALLSFRKVTVAVSSIRDVADDKIDFGVIRETSFEDLLLSVTQGPMKVSHGPKYNLSPPSSWIRLLHQ